MQAYVWLLEAEPSKHPVIIINSWMGISGPLEIVGAFRGTRRCGPYGDSHLCQIALRVFRTSCYVFIYSTTFAFCQGCVLPLSQCFCIVIRPRTQGSKRKCRVGQFVEERKKKAGPFASQEGADWARRAVPLQDVGIDGSIGGLRLTGHDAFEAQARESCPYIVRLLDWATGGMKPDCTLGLVDQTVVDGVESEFEAVGNT
jgi:hypothetical protein